ncbi:MAG: glycine cleavage system protein GcvH [Chloroflexi bacterium]|nr:glycine cleavage system protein GcvH [Chloroflexota bacterium]
MPEVRQQLKYTKEHEWVRPTDDTAVVGISDYAQEQLGDVVFVELPAGGTEVTQFETFGTIESVKAASDLYSPVSGTVVEVNAALKDRPELLNQSPYDEGWLVKVKLKDRRELDVLLSPTEYDTLIGSLE